MHTSSLLTSFFFKASLAAAFVADLKSSAACLSFCCWSAAFGFLAAPCKNRHEIISQVFTKNNRNIPFLYHCLTSRYYFWKVNQWAIFESNGTIKFNKNAELGIETSSILFAQYIFSCVSIIIITIRNSTMYVLLKIISVFSYLFHHITFTTLSVS